VRKSELVQRESLVEGKIYAEDYGDNKEVTQVYYYQYDGEIEDLIFSDNEVEEVKWLSKDEIIEVMKTNSDQWASSMETFVKINNDLSGI